MSNEEDIKQILQPIFRNNFLIEQKLCEKAIKILLKFIEAAAPAAPTIHKDKEEQVTYKITPKEIEYKFLSLGQVRHNFKAITSHECLLVCGELERLGFLEGRLQFGRLKYRFNLDPAKAAKELLSPPREVLLAAQKRFEEQVNKKLLNAAKTIKRFQPQTYGITVAKMFKPLSEVEKDFKQFVEGKTALELHQSNECDSNVCRFCALEKGA